MAKEVKERFSVNMKTEDGKLKAKFSPVVDNSNFTQHYQNLVNGFVNAYLNLFQHVIVLRPATQEERDLHCYIFETNDIKDAEHTIKNARKALYDETKKMFDSVLQNVFPDIQYLEDCKEYAEKYYFEDYSNKDDYLAAVTDLSKKVRENYANIIAQVSGGDGVEIVTPEAKNEEGTKEDK